MIKVTFVHAVIFLLIFAGFGKVFTHGFTHRKFGLAVMLDWSWIVYTISPFGVFLGAQV